MYIVSEARLSQLPSKKPKAGAVDGIGGTKVLTSKAKASVSEKSKGGVDSGQYDVLEKIHGSSLVGLK